jgi:hypothetical protein
MKTHSDVTRLVFSMMLAAMAGTGCTPPGPGAGPAAGPTNPVQGPEAQSAPTSEVLADSPASEQGESDGAEPVSAADTVPPGLTPLTDEEAEEAEKHCAGLSKALAKAVSADKSGRDRTEVLLEALQKGVSASGVDLPRCTELVRRDLLVYRARVIESEAINHIKLLSFGLASATQKEPPILCASAGPTPADLASLEAGAVLVPASAWSSPGWTCARFQPQTPLRFQYELRMNEAAQTYEIVARGYPVAGQRAVELFQKGNLRDGRIEPSSEVLRR